MTSIAAASYIGVDKRTSPRTDIYASIHTVLADGRAVMMTLVNISADGVLVRHSEPVADGDIVQMSFPVIGKLGGIAIWSIGGRSGIIFNQTIELGDYEAMLRALGVRLV